MSTEEPDRPEWQIEHERWVASLPDDVREAHRHSIRHRSEILASRLCGCFYCGSFFQPGEIEIGVDDDSDGRGHTALCPRCGIDSVIGDKSGFPASSEFMTRMNSYWFAASRQLG